MVRYIAAAIVVLSLTAPVAANPAHKVVCGTVTDDTKQPIIGATVILLADGDAVAGMATDQSGKFRFTVKDTYAAMTLRVSSVGYLEHERALNLLDSLTVVKIECTPKAIELSTVVVRPEKELNLDKIAIPADQIARLSARSLVFTNPIAAIQYPQLAKVGSAHSSQIRINGTSPTYYLNGISIGSDPNHYGMFSVIPGSIVEQIDFQPQGTDASYALPSIINLKSASTFGNESSHELNFSTLEATASLKKSSDKTYLVGAARKSVLDALVNSFDLKGDKTTIPPTSFTDVYLSTGVKLSSRYQMGIDQYHAYDYLAFNTEGSTGANSAVQTYQRARENYVGLRLKSIYSSAVVGATLAVRDGRRSYQAMPGSESSMTAVNIDLSESQRTYLGSLNADMDFGSWELKAGNETEYVSERKTDLTEKNWSFLPPFSTSDNPYIYQAALNYLYGTYHGELSQLTSAAYISASKSFGGLNLTGGLRSAYYRHLSANAPALVRLSGTMRFSGKSSATLFYGTFSEDPINVVLESYQVQIRKYAGQLRPISTQLLSFDYSLGPCKVGLFTKKITDMPVMTPDFERPVINNQVNPDFLQVRSEGSARFYGGSFALDMPRFVLSKLSFYGSYAYSHATRTDHGVTFPYETNATHRFTSQFDYRLSKKVSFGSDIQVRSGYRYSPGRELLAYTERYVYNESYYQKVLGQENSLQFKPNMAVNFHMAFDFGNMSLHMAITNVTNRYNPIIKSPSGFVYDAGILPTLGLKWRF